MVNRDGTGLTRSSAATMVAAAAGIAIGLVRATAGAGVLGRAGVGPLANLTLLPTTAMVIATAVAGQGAVRALAAMRSGEASDQRHWLERYLFLGPLMVGTALAGAFAVLAGPIAEVITGSGTDAGLILIIAVAAPVAALAASTTGLVQAALRVSSIARADVITTLVSLPLTVGLVVAWGLPGGVLAVGLAYLVRLVALRASNADLVPRGDWLAGLRIPSGALRPVVSVGAAAATVAIATAGGALLVRAQIVGTLGIDASGLYQPIAAVSEVYLDALIMAPALYLLPRLTELLGRRAGSAASYELGAGLRLSLAISMPVILVAIGFSSTVLHLLYSPAFEAASSPLAIQMAGMVLKMVAVCAGVALVPLGRARAWVLITLLVVVTRYAGAVILLPGFGLSGAAIAFDAAWALGAMVTLLVLRRSGRIGLQVSDLHRAGVAGLLSVAVLVSGMIDEPAGAVVALVAAGAWIVVSRRELRSLLRAIH